ncbi:hypothetical protein DRP43_00110 [candidate division TA06 bacterium]|uniref:PpiC domain-containing protein n=1 Tax=candidate division TA06 bacterium TaxID=2250710 RepID=A0A660SRB6_UNCT6|nr:MAG: hypothetical protein DRP43_00110 [candidate division TA06 bacterium]
MRKVLIAVLIVILTNTLFAETISDNIEAVVEDDVITSGELQMQLFTYFVQLGITDTTQVMKDSLSKVILNQMISDKVINVIAKKDTTITVDNSEIETALRESIDNIRSNFPDESAFKKSLKEEGLTIGELKRKYKKKIKEQILVKKYLQNTISFIPEIPQEEIDSFYNINKDSIPTNYPGTYKLSHIYIVYKPGKYSLSQIEKKINNILSEYNDNVSFSTLVKKYSEDSLTANNGGLWGNVGKKDILPEIYGQISDIGEGQVKIVQSRLGYHLILCEGRSEDKYILRQILIIPKVTSKDSLEMKQIAYKVDNLLDKGISFKKLVVKYSDDLQTKDVDGYLGEFEEMKMNPELLKHLKGLEGGMHTNVIETPLGFEIIHIDKYIRGKDITTDEIKNNIRNMLLQKKQQNLIEELVVRLKKDVYIAINE